MSRRGPQRANRTGLGESAGNTEEVSRKAGTPVSDGVACTSRAKLDMDVLPLFRASGWFPSLTTEESILLDHYIQRFSRTYPTCQGPSNPFLSTLLPYALQNKVVLDALLALSGAQHWESDGMTMEKATLQLRHRALRGCQTLLNQPNMKVYMERRTQQQTFGHLVAASEVLPLIACCALLLLYEKLVGNGKSNWMPHLSFLATVFRHLPLIKQYRSLGAISQRSEQNEIFEFLYNLFLYNDLVHSTATGTTTLSDYYLTSILSACFPSDASMTNRYYYPYLVAQIAAANASITEADIDAWDGRLDWLPSFSSVSWARPDSNAQTKSNEHVVAAQLYRYTAKILLRQSLRRRCTDGSVPMQDTETSILAEQAAHTLPKLPEGSSFENALLWPIGICAKELTESQALERMGFMYRLQQLERRFHMRHFKRMQEVLEVEWARADRGLPSNGPNSRGDIFLLG